MILSDFDLRNYVTSGRLVIRPFSKEILRENGVDLRIGYEMARLRRLDAVLDLSEATEDDLRRYYTIEHGKEFVITPGEHVLVCTLEYLEMPSDLMGFVELRSTFARLGLVMPPTIIDASFKGQLTLEVRGGPFPVKLKAGMRFAHVIFAKLMNPVEKPYRGRYYDQRGVTLPKPLREKISTHQF
ncbi:MAG: dCTP deaminase [Thermoprotei archaeon]|nr:dCTP deaminase [Thermoprotei archaeon]